MASKNGLKICGDAVFCVSARLRKMAKTSMKSLRRRICGDTLRRQRRRAETGPKMSIKSKRYSCGDIKINFCGFGVGALPHNPHFSASGGVFCSLCRCVFEDLRACSDAGQRGIARLRLGLRSRIRCPDSRQVRQVRQAGRSGRQVGRLWRINWEGCRW